MHGNYEARDGMRERECHDGVGKNAILKLLPRKKTRLSRVSILPVRTCFLFVGIAGKCARLWFTVRWSRECTESTRPEVSARSGWSGVRTSYTCDCQLVNGRGMVYGFDSLIGDRDSQGETGLRFERLQCHTIHLLKQDRVNEDKSRVDGSCPPIDHDDD
jgi:hypothetical protein